MSPRGWARLAVWSVPLLNVVLWIAVAIRPPPRAPVVEWPPPLILQAALVLFLFAAWAMQTRRGNQARQVVERALDLGERLRPAARRDVHARAILAVLSEPMGAHLNAKARNAAKFPKSAGLKQPRAMGLVRKFRLICVAKDAARHVTNHGPWPWPIGPCSDWRTPEASFERENRRRCVW